MDGTVRVKRTTNMRNAGVMGLRGRVVAGALGIVVSVVALSPATVSAQAGRALVEEGNRLYREGRFQEAHEKYLEAMAEAPGTPVIPFNDGNALYQGADYERAMEAYRQAIESGDPGLASAAWYNLGNAMYRQQQLEPALEAYKQALRLDPGDGDAKYNLERVLEELQQQEQQQQQGDSDQEEDEDEQDQNQDQQQQPQEQPQGGGGEEEEDSREEQQSGADDPREDEGEEEEDQDSSPEDGQQPPPQGQPEPRPGEMTEQEAQRLLDAIDENPEDVNRRPAMARGRKPKKPW